MLLMFESGANDCVFDSNCMVSYNDDPYYITASFLRRNSHGVYHGRHDC